jgi:hypothetical protein
MKNAVAPIPFAGTRTSNSTSSDRRRWFRVIFENETGRLMPPLGG